MRLHKKKIDNSIPVSIKNIRSFNRGSVSNNFGAYLRRNYLLIKWYCRVTKLKYA